MSKKDLQNMSDEQLLELAKSQDTEAIEQLLERYKYVASAVAHSYFLNGGDAEDLLQEGMIAVFNAINTFNGKASFKSYVYTCVKNKIITLIKQSNRYKNQPLNNYISFSGFLEGDADKNELLTDFSFGPEEVIINTEAENELKNIITKTLSEYEHDILVYYLKGYSYREISEKFNKKEKSIDNALQRIRKKILLAKASNN
ncbi:MAG: sigma-70 family RNA polymerase sigma factor [Clostridiales bacterium]|nr:sigma-70 family RNA polymerase sigma factor [Clostridiales bacterium]